MPITSTAPVLTPTGISAPSYADILTYLQTQYQTIFGADVYIQPDSQDGQWIAIIAQAISDANSVSISVYNAFNPNTAQGVSLSSNVKLNGITRLIPTKSAVDLLINGQAGISIINGIAQDIAGTKWNLPATVAIPVSGFVTVTATSDSLGAISALPHTINIIGTPQLGWQTVDNPLAAVLGAPVEGDAELRKRQVLSCALPAQTVLGSILSAVAALSGVTRYTAYENPTSTIDANGLPPNSIAVVVEGGNSLAIATAIANKKTIGCATYGTTSQIVTDAFGISRAIKFFIVSAQPIQVAINLRPVNGYTDAIGTEIKNAIAAYINMLPIGASVFLTRVYGPAILANSGNADGNSYEIMSLKMAIIPATPVAADVTILFNQVAHCNASDVIITLV